jgi:hypothetical protein
MQQVSFSLPSLATAQMAAQDQINVTVNQATAVIVCAYLEHLNKLTEVIPPSSQLTAHVSVMSTAELVSLINDVQTALRTV